VHFLVYFCLQYWKCTVQKTKKVLLHIIIIIIIIVSYNPVSIRLFLLYFLPNSPISFSSIPHFVIVENISPSPSDIRSYCVPMLSSFLPSITGETTIKQSKSTSISFAVLLYIPSPLCLMSPSCSCTNFVVSVPAWLHIIDQRSGTSDEGHRQAAKT